jgi:D-alanine-D-alanine ligase
MSQKLRVAILFGGKSGEHDVSLMSAASVIESINLEKYEVIPIGITKEGAWRPGQASLPLIAPNMTTRKLEQLQSNLPAVTTSAAQSGLPSLCSDEIDVVFPVLHGTYGEDGTVQGLLEMANIAYVGAGVFASAAAMDKVFAKKIFAQAGLPQGKYTYFRKSDLIEKLASICNQVEEELGYPCFVKPANLGSSVGISKVTHREELVQAFALAAKYDRKIIVEEFIAAREIEVAILGNDHPQASVPGEIIPCNDFYDYQAKYIDGKSIIQIPADLTADVQAKIRSMALQVYQALDGSGLARIDFFLRRENNEILVNEMNTMPGFTPFSMYAKLWEYSGISYADLVSRLIELALERHREKAGLVTTFAVE